MDTTTRTPAQQAAYDRFMGTAQTVRDQHAQGILDDEGNYIGPDAQDSTPTPAPAVEAVVVHVDRTPGGGNTRRGRSATIFVEYAEGTPQEAVRKAATAHLLPGESLWGDCCRLTGFTARPNMFEFAVYPA